MIDLLIFFLKYAFLVFIYIFLFWLLLLVAKDLRQSSGKRPAPPAHRRARLILKSGPGIDEPRSFVVKDEISIGRGGRNLVPLDDEAASDEHAGIYVADNGRFVIVDLGSTNGTFVDNKIVAGPTPLQNGSTIKIGRSLMVFMER